MSEIKVLPENLINQIAAGEVVERPASVVKELLENSLDAEAQRIIVEVKGGGDGWLRITDDGCGMDREDALLSFERHATSKISSPDDLFNIHSFGFRGEAIASIASVSYMSLQTKKRGANEGTLILCEGGKIRKNKELGCPEGTQIEIKQLFFNTPARKKYLKNDATEFGHITDIVMATALAYPEVAFKLVHDNKVVFDLPATEDLLARARGLLGRAVSDELIPVFYGGTNVRLEGYIGKPSIGRASRNSQYLYVNRRPVKSHVLSYAVKQTFHSLLPKEKYPVFLLYITINPQMVDVNVHPRKQEVKFANEKEIYSIFTIACKKALEKHVLAPRITPQESFLHESREHQSLHTPPSAPAPAPAMPINMTITVPLTDEEEAAEETASVSDVRETEGPAHGTGQAATQYSAGDNVTPSPSNNTTTYEVNADNAPDVSGTIQERALTEELVPLGQFDLSYILAQQGKQLVIIDQHAAHERIRYTEILEEFEARKHSSQQLLTPEQMELSHQEVALMEANKDLLAGLGFEIESFGGNTFSVYSVPAYLAKHDIRSTILGIIDDISRDATKGDFQARKERAITFAACRSAVKFGDLLSDQEQTHLLKRLMQMKLPYTCPHGRPTMITVSPDELKKRFGRDYRSVAPLADDMPT